MATKGAESACILSAHPESADVATDTLRCAQSDACSTLIALSEADARLQNALRDAAHEWRQTVDAIDDAIVMFDPPATIRRMNRSARELLGCRDYELVGKAIDPRTRPEPWPSVLALVDEAAKRGIGFTRQIHDAASEKTWHIVGNVSAAREVHDVVVIVRDITETVALEESVRRSEMMSAMGNLVAGVAHEVKNPLFGLTATLDAMELKFRASPDAMRYTTMMRREVGRLNNLMRDLLDYGRAVSLDVQPVIVGSVIASAVKLVRDAASQRGVHIANDVQPDFGVARGDFSRLEQMFRNILDNAISFSPSGRTVTIAAHHVERTRRYEIEIRDEGPGFAPADLPHVFEPFFTRRKGGTGLGLPIVRRTVEEHGGRVTAGNAALGGAIVRIELPAARR